MPKAWPMLASALNRQLGWGAQWKVVEGSLFMRGLELSGRICNCTPQQNDSGVDSYR